VTVASAQSVVRSAVGSVQIAEVAARREELLREQCTGDERSELAGRHVQSLAGSLALKQALVVLLGGPRGADDVRPSEIEIRRRADGAPTVTRLPAALQTGGLAVPPTLRVSISHTRDAAVGLAVVTESGAHGSEDAPGPTHGRGGRG